MDTTYGQKMYKEIAKEESLHFDMVEKGILHIHIHPSRI